MQCLSAKRAWSARCVVRVALFFLSAARAIVAGLRVGLSSSKWLNGGRALINRQLPSPSPLSSSLAIGAAMFSAMTDVKLSARHL